MKSEFVDGVPRFAVLGVGGYIAPRHLEAIASIGGEVVACFDPHDSVGVIDRYFPEASFFTEFERFDRHVHKVQNSDRPIDFVSICSPNHLHDPHIRWALRMGADPICEKPLVLNPANLDYLIKLEQETGHRINAVLQLRLHPAIQELKAAVEAEPHKRHVVDIVTVTPRGRWYHYSWKGDPAKSGGLASNIGIHLFDMLLWVFGRVRGYQVECSTPERSAGTLDLEKASVRWDLSIDANDLARHGQSERKPYRSISVDGLAVSFATGFESLHLKSYQGILAGRGYAADDARPAIELLSKL